MLFLMVKEAEALAIKAKLEEYKSNKQAAMLLGENDLSLQQDVPNIYAEHAEVRKENKSRPSPIIVFKYVFEGIKKKETISLNNFIVLFLFCMEISLYLKY